LRDTNYNRSECQSIRSPEHKKHTLRAGRNINVNKQQARRNHGLHGRRVFLFLYKIAILPTFILLTGIALLAWWLWRRRRNKKNEK
jgi:uncharacterized iron-regulated membrane protein